MHWMVILLALSAAGDQPGNAASLLLPCATRQSATFAVTVDDGGRVVRSVARQGEAGFVRDASKEVLPLLVPPGPPPLGMLGSSRIVETVTVNCQPPGIPPPLPFPSSARPVRIGGSIEPPFLWLDVQPIYPRATGTGIEGRVTVQGVLQTDGSVRDARALTSIPTLDAAAVYAVAQRRFTPAVLNGVPVPIVITQVVAFPPR